ncbi:snRNA-activating protein complex subunit 1 [Hyla sarda]|uniref:snRNA-activating protein complex subunit 1 n=1 Tax=Hyla sarda TaxID=327740 RepID=UPI0024C4215B|nr:snRNA-activating protein complex subunit 1 [Hyla sarda]XP_056401948.1 snRNA-activating protein complex subunit 1 [Hyla sarda]XP_056401949.1 snRNA-activating protein complex subunit 1 [Hyla sarda]XP_056401950.1 snRNA-activating protein complex subunit 1 [Hyla sarda]XP_056401951.1 snRNA-activating protein complex subunit 1 [Hyla sarda]XP_056401952.1 snRNA-activating protein complex subunit 1 [Hyla sarda]
MDFPGIKEDCETFLGLFQATDSVRFEEFLSVWKGIKFSTIYHGGMRNLECNTFTRELFSVASTYFLPPYTFQIRVGAMYLLYGLYNTQLCQPKQKIRISLKDWADVEQFHQELIGAEHLDAVYVFRQMRRMRAFYFTGMPTMLTFRSQKSIQPEPSKEEFIEKKDRVSDLVTLESLEEIMNIQEHYQKTKCHVSDKSAPDKTLSLIKEDFTDNLQTLLEGYQFWKQQKMAPKTKTDDEEGTSQESEGSERARHLAQIKSKTYNAVTQAVRSRRHRQVELVTATSAETEARVPITRAERERLRRAKKTAEREAAKKANMLLPQKKPGKMPMIPEENSSSSSEDLPASKRERKD